jgi:hypothetical protein
LLLSILFALLNLAIYQPWQKRAIILACENAEEIIVEFPFVGGPEYVSLVGDRKGEFCKILPGALQRKPFPIPVPWRSNPTMGRECVFLRVVSSDNKLTRFRLHTHGGTAHAIRNSEMFARLNSRCPKPPNYEGSTILVSGFALALDKLSK